MNHSKSLPKIEDMVSLKVDNLTCRTTAADLKQVFERFGKIGDIYIPRDKITRESRGFAFVRYLDKRDADNAIEMVKGHLVDGRQIRVQIARYGRPTSSNKRNRIRSRWYSRSRSRERHSRSNSKLHSRSHSYSSRRRSNSTSSTRT